MSNLQKINLLGSSFSLKIDEDPEYFKKIIKQIEIKISQIEEEMHVKDPLRIALLSCILIQDDLLKEKESKLQFQSEGDAAKAEQMTLEIISLIDRTIN